jgi:uncharacterized OB-fold protein
MHRVQSTEAGERSGETLETTAATAKARAGYGLPCANCGAYYLAVLDSCPVCRYRERVSPVFETLKEKQRDWETRAI